MKRSRFTEEQIIAILREQEAGVPTAEVCRKHGISSATFYKWKAKFGGLDERRAVWRMESESCQGTVRARALSAGVSITISQSNVYRYHRIVASAAEQSNRRQS